MGALEDMAAALMAGSQRELQNDSGIQMSQAVNDTISASLPSVMQTLDQDDIWGNVAVGLMGGLGQGMAGNYIKSRTEDAILNNAREQNRISLAADPLAALQESTLIDEASRLGLETSFTLERRALAAKEAKEQAARARAAEALKRKTFNDLIVGGIKSGTMPSGFSMENGYLNADNIAYALNPQFQEIQNQQTFDSKLSERLAETKTAFGLKDQEAAGSAAGAIRGADLGREGIAAKVEAQAKANALAASTAKTPGEDVEVALPDYYPRPPQERFQTALNEANKTIGTVPSENSKQARLELNRETDQALDKLKDFEPVRAQASEMKRFAKLLESTSYDAKNFGTPLEGIQSVMDKAGQVFGSDDATRRLSARTLADGTLSSYALRQRAPGTGQMSDKDLEVYQSIARAGIVDQKSMAVMAKAIAADAALTETYGLFLEDYVNKNKTAAGAERVWLDYVNDNPITERAGDGSINVIYTPNAADARKYALGSAYKDGSRPAISPQSPGGGVDGDRAAREQKYRDEFRAGAR